jgi:vitamin B12 transporter
MRIQLLGSIVGFGTLVIAASTARADSTDSTETLGPIVVTATRIPTPESQVASSITVITADDIMASQASTVPDVLKFVPGLNLVQTGGPGGQTSIFTRGTNSDHTKVLVDGIDVSDPSNSTSFEFGHFLTADIDQIEVLRGPQSGLYGSDAIGGVINIITKSGDGPPQFAAAIEGGSFQTFNQAASVRGSDEQFHYSFNIEHEHSGATPVTPPDLLLPGDHRNDDYYDNITASTKLGFAVTSTLDFGLVGRYTDTHLRFTSDDFDPVTFASLPSPLSSGSDTTGIYGRTFAHLISFNGFLDQTLGFSYTHNRSINITPDSPDSLATGERIKFDWQGALKFSDSETLLLGAEHARDSVGQPLSAGIDIESGYAELQSKFDDRFFLATNVRYDDNDRFGSKVTFRVAPTYVIPETGTRFKASVGTGFKAPTVSQLFQDFPDFDFFANPNLRPESSLGYDVGVEQGFAADTVRVGATYFNIKLHHLITTSADGTTYANIDEATSQGVESFVSYRPWSQLVLRVDYTYTDAQDDGLKLELKRRPKNKATLNATWQTTSALSFNTDVLYVGNWIDVNRDFTIPRLNAPGFITVNVAGKYDVTRQWSVYARINNLLDRRYEEPIGFLQPTIGLYAGVKARF